MSRVDCKIDNPPSNGERKSSNGNGQGDNGQRVLDKINLASPDMKYIKSLPQALQQKLLEECYRSSDKNEQEFGRQVNRTFQWARHFNVAKVGRNTYYKKGG